MGNHFLENTTMTIQNNAIIGFTAETFIHSGCGQSQGAIDLPFSREKATDYPYIPGSSLKGAFRDYSENNNLKDKDIGEIFGKSDNAGKLLFSDLRLLLLPVRSLTTAYKWVTCPHILKRLMRDLQRIDKSVEFSKETYELTNDKATLFLEELSFGKVGDATIDDPSFNTLKGLCGIIKEKEKIVIISDDNFNWFANNALSIQARNVLNDNKTSENLWYEENLPPDTLMYGLLNNRKTDEDTVGTIINAIDKNAYIQVGGNETVGMGWFHMAVFPRKKEGE